MYKLRFYKLTGAEKGNLEHEEFFNTLEEMQNKYNEVFKYELKAYNPTAWYFNREENQKNNNWERIIGF